MFVGERKMKAKFTGFTEAALDVIRTLPSNDIICIILDDDGCCGVSRVFVRKGMPKGEWLELYRNNRVSVVVHPRFAGSLDGNLLIDAVDSASDDSLSVETRLGKKLFLRRATPSSHVSA